MTSRRFLTAALAAVLAGVPLMGCTAKESTPAKESTAPGNANAQGAPVTVNATDTECALSTASAGPGRTTFAITNNGTKVTEVYVYGAGDRVLAEVENIPPGLQRELVVAFNDAGTYKIACKPGMVGDGIRSEFTVKAATAQGAAG